MGYLYAASSRKFFEDFSRKVLFLREEVTRLSTLVARVKDNLAVQDYIESKPEVEVILKKV